ncbi:MAG: hypothetical protein HWE30_17505 [Methylocystaceae bacterium]|nr:hypothetical protein [Methylocystaceae bacterium]
MESMSKFVCSQLNSFAFAPSPELLLTSTYSGVWSFCSTDRTYGSSAKTGKGLVQDALSCGRFFNDELKFDELGAVALLNVGVPFAITKAVRETLQRCSIKENKAEFCTLPFDYFYQSEDFCPQFMTRLYGQQIDHALEENDVLVLPALPDLPLDLKQAQAGKVSAQEYLFISPIYHSGNPVVAMPISPIRGKPMSILLVGKKGGDATLLKIAELFGARILASF